jgi:lambda family phage tail tape measure protein
VASNITVVLTVDNQSYIANLNKAEQETKDFAATGVKAGKDVADSFDKLNTSTTHLNGHLSKLKGALLGAAFLGFARSAILTADGIDDLSKSTGMAIDKIVGFRNALMLGGGTADGAAKAITTLYQQIDAARQGAAGAQDAFSRVGITLTALKGQDEDVFYNTLEALAKMPEGAAKTAMQISLLGKEGRNVSINREFIDNLKAGEEGAVKTAEAIRRAAALNDAWAKSFETLKLQFLEAFTPLIKSVSWLIENIPGLTLAFKALGVVIVGIAVASGFRAIVSAVGMASRGVSALIGGMQKLKDMGGIGKALAGTTQNKGIGQIRDAASAIGLGAGVVGGVGMMIGGSVETPESPPKPPGPSEDNEVIDANAGKKASIKDVADAYLEANRKAREAIDLETSLIGLGKKEQDTRKALADIMNRERDAIDKLTKQKEALSAAEQRAGLGGKIDEQIDRIKAQTAANKEELAASIAAKNASEIGDAIVVAGRGRVYDITKQIADLKFNTATAGMGELDSKIENITKSANDWKNSTIQALANAQGISVEAFAKLYPERVAEVYKAAAEGLRELTGAAKENFIAQQGINDLTFGIQQRISAEKELTQIQNDMANIGLSSIEKKYKSIDAAAQAAIKTQVDAADKALYGAKGVAEGMSIKNLDPERYNNIVKSATASTEKLKEGAGGLYDASRTFEAGWSEAFAKFVEDASNAAMQSQQLFTNLTKGIEDAFVNFAKTGKLSFKDLLSSIAEQLLRSNIKQLLSNIFSPNGSSGSLLNTIISGGRNLMGFAGGGIIPTNAPVIVGERGPEIISGAAGRMVTPNNQLGGTNVTYNINAVDAMSFKQMIARDPSFIHAVASQGAKSVPTRR